MPKLEIERDDRFVARERRIHRGAVVAMALAVLAGAVGLFGYGPLSSATREGAGYRVTYDQFSRNGAPLELTIETTKAGELPVWIDDTLLDATQLERVLPVAAKEHRTHGGVTFLFEDSLGGSQKVSFYFTGNALGLVRGRVGRSRRDSVPLRIFFYP